MAPLLRAAAWLCLGFIVFVTVAPISLRPHDALPVNLDRALAFGLMSGLFTLAYPRHWKAVLLLSVAGAGMIETLQYLSPTRHAHLADALVKGGGALAGGGLMAVVNRLLRRDGSAAAGTADGDGPVTLLWISEDDEEGVSDLLKEARAAGEDVTLIRLPPSGESGRRE